MPRYRFRHALVAVLLFVALLSQGTWALAGTTGGMSGTVTTADTGAPIANAKVTVSSPSQTAVGQTDATGRFTFISLAPDTYTVSLEKDGFQPASTPGITVFADSTQTIALHMESALKTIAATVSRATGSLVKPGTTADVYSINAATQDKISGLGGGGSLNSAYSAIASVPGAFVPLNQTGYFQTVHIRGGDYDQVGYELDGVPVNRSFDNYPSGAASSLGQQELQVYTGANPASSEGQGLAGFINQVIKTGTYPGFGTGYLGLATPTFYHKLALEVGGASPNRNFSYYFGIGGYNQDFRYIDNANGAGYADLGSPSSQLPDPAACASPFTGYSACYANGGVGPGGYSLFPYQYGALSNISDRDIIANLHFALPHKFDGGRDDVQLLWDSGYLLNQYYSTLGDSALQNTGNNAYADAFQWNCGVGPTATLNANCVGNYLYPGSSSARAVGATIPGDLRDVTRNNQEVVKLQYQKNIGTDAFFRLYGYTYYSDWLQNGPNGANLNYIGTGASPDYELSSHTRGIAATFSKQLNAQNLVTLQASYTTASTLRANNTQMFNGGGTRGRGIVAVNAAAPYLGYCFDSTGAVAWCSPAAGHTADFATWAGVQGGGAPALPGSCALPASTGIASTACTWMVGEDGKWVTYNTVTPKFTSFSITDEFRPNDKWLLSLGLRENQYQFIGGDTHANDPIRQFWYRAWNLGNCIDANGVPQPNKTLTACPAGSTQGNMINASSAVNRYTSLEPRLSGTFTMNPDTVVRFSAGKYSEPPNTAFEQYDTLERDAPFALLGTAFYKFGFNTPSHAVRPPTSYNYDLSLEKHLKGTDVSFKLTPFLRKTKDQIQQFFLDQASGFVSGLNVGRQTSEGFEFQLTKGDFARNGLSGQLSFAYTYSYINYDKLSNGSSVVTGMNSDIAAYNALTQAGGGAKCYTAAGAADAACAVGSIANPYYNAPVQPLLDQNGSYPTYDLFPGPIGSSAQSFGAPYVTTLILNYKHDKLTITPSLQYVAGARYGAPETVTGIDPTAGCAALTAPGATTVGDPRYPYGAVGGSPYDATTCNATLAAIPNPFTGKFDALGAFLQPSQLIGNVQVSYEVSPKLSLVGTFANVVNRCFGGTKAAWTLTDQNVCSYGIINNAGAFAPVGNVYNWSPTAQTPIQRLVRYPYGAYLGSVNVDGNSTKTPFNFYLEARIKL